MERTALNSATNYFHVTSAYRYLLPGCPELETYRMNIVAVSLSQQLLFIAGKKFIYYYRLHLNGQVDDSHTIAQLNSPLENPGKINQLKVKNFSYRYEYLVAVDMRANVLVYDVNRLQDQAIVLDNNYDGIEDCSTWSLDLHFSDRHKYVAVGSNSKRITIWDLNSTTPQSQSLRQVPPRRTINVMRHNIPCLQFSPCGEFLCATSIDEHVRIFRTSDGALLREVRTDEWGWTVNWILKTDVTNFSTESEVFYSTSHKQDIKSGPLKGRRKDQKNSSADSQMQQSRTDNTQDQNDTANKLNQYLILNSSQYEFYLIDAATIKILQKKELRLRQNFYYNQVARYSLSQYMSDSNLAIYPPQHTPFLHLLEIVYDINSKNFFMEQVSIDKPAATLASNQNSEQSTQIIQQNDSNDITLGFCAENVQKGQSAGKQIILAFLLKYNRQIEVLQIERENQQVQNQQKFEEIALFKDCDL